MQRHKITLYICQINKLSFTEQNTLKNKDFDNWKMDYKQLDDVLVVGIEV